MPPRGGRKKRGGWRGGRGRGGASRPVDAPNDVDSALVNDLSRLGDDSQSYGMAIDRPDVDGASFAANMVDDSISEASDASTGDAGELAVTSPPARNTLEREAGKLRARFRATRRAFFLAQIAEIDRRIADAQRESPGDADSPAGPEAKPPGGASGDDRAARLRERHRMRVERVLADYRYRVKEAEDELAVAEAALRTPSVTSAALPKAKAAPLPDAWVDDDIARMKRTMRT